MAPIHIVRVRAYRPPDVYSDTNFPHIQSRENSMLAEAIETSSVLYQCDELANRRLGCLPHASPERTHCKGELA